MRKLRRGVKLGVTAVNKRDVKKEKTGQGTGRSAEAWGWELKVAVEAHHYDGEIAAPLRFVDLDEEYSPAVMAFGSDFDCASILWLPGAALAK